MSWLRLYADAIDDPKLQMLAFEDRWHFIAILCCKKQGLLDGDDKEFAQRLVRVKLGLDQTAFEEMVKRLAAVKLIDRATLQPIAWDRRQYVSDQDPTHAERQRRYREKNKEPSRDATVTRHGNDQKQSTETDTEEASRLSAGVVASRNDAQQSPESSPETASTQGDDNVHSGVPRNPCPAERIVDLYHAKLPMARRVEQLTPTRRAALRARWHNELPTLDAFGNYFDDVAASRFLTGRVNGHGDRKPFVADFDWLLKPSNLVKVLEGKYHDG